MSFEKLRNYELYGGLSFFLGAGVLIFLLVKGLFLYTLLSFILLLTIGLVATDKYTKLQNRLNDAMKKRIASLQPSANDFQNTVEFIPDSLTVKLVFDFPAKRLYIWRPVDIKKELSLDMPFNIFTYAFDDLTEVKIIANDQTIADSKHFSGNEADSITEKMQFKRLKSLILEIQLNDTCHILPFYKSISGNGNIPVRPIVPAYKQNVKLIKECFAILNNIAHGKISELPMMETMTSEQPQTPLVNENEDVAILPVSNENEQATRNTIDVEVAAVTDDSTAEPTSASFVTKETETSELEEDKIAMSEMDTNYTETKSAFADFEKFLESNKQKQFGSSTQDEHDENKKDSI